MIRWSAIFCVVWAGAAWGEEITTNGTGGGRWSDPGTWRGGKIPGSQDDVNIRKFDVVSFDLPTADQPHCQKLQIDPKGIFQFKTNSGPLTFLVADAIENYGTIKVDGTRSNQDRFEIRMVGTSANQLKITLAKGSGLLIYGFPGLPDGKKNVILRTQDGKDPKDPRFIQVAADGQAGIDWQRGAFENVKLNAQKLDNTGARPNERIQVLDCLFQGVSGIRCQGCDTPVFSRNIIDYQGSLLLPEPAINMNLSPLAEIKNNLVRGKFQVGIAFANQTDTSVQGNQIEGCIVGIQGSFGIANSMMKQNQIKNCPTGLKLEGGTGVIEEVTIDGCKTALQTAGSRWQVTHLMVKNLDQEGLELDVAGGTVFLLNTNLSPDRIRVEPADKAKIDKKTKVKTKGKTLFGLKPELEAVVCQQYVIVGVPDAPEGSLVDFRTKDSKLAADITDPNVRNTPAPLIQKKSPGPRALQPIIVRSWSIDNQGELYQAPEYTLSILGPPPKEGEARPVLKTETFRPAPEAFRPNLDEDTPTVEVKLK